MIDYLLVNRSPCGKTCWQLGNIPDYHLCWTYPAGVETEKIRRRRWPEIPNIVGWMPVEAASHCHSNWREVSFAADQHPPLFPRNWRACKSICFRTDIRLHPSWNTCILSNSELFCSRPAVVPFLLWSPPKIEMDICSRKFVCIPGTLY